MTVRSVFLSVPGAAAQGNYKDTGHHSRLCKQINWSPALHALWRRAVVPVGTSMRGDCSPKVHGVCTSHEELIR